MRSSGNTRFTAVALDVALTSWFHVVTTCSTLCGNLFIVDPCYVLGTRSKELNEP